MVRGLQLVLGECLLNEWVEEKREAEIWQLPLAYKLLEIEQHWVKT